jgi:putative membrane protein
MSALFAFLHHVAAFTLVGALAVEFASIRGELTVARARTLQLADAAVGVSAAVVLLVGGLRVFYFEKGSEYYFHSAPFIAKVGIFVLVALLSIYPTVEFVSWTKALEQGRVPEVGPRKLRTMRALIHWELAGVVALLLCAALMARGAGYFG